MGAGQQKETGASGRARGTTMSTTSVSLSTCLRNSAGSSQLDPNSDTGVIKQSFVCGHAPCASHPITASHMYHITLRCVTSYHITLRCITSHYITLRSHHITLHHITSHSTTSHHTAGTTRRDQRGAHLYPRSRPVTVTVTCESKEGFSTRQFRKRARCAFTCGHARTREHALYSSAKNARARSAVCGNNDTHAGRVDVDVLVLLIHTVRHISRDLRRVNRNTARSESAAQVGRRCPTALRGTRVHANVCMRASTHTCCANE